MSGQFEGKVAIVTGGASGIGRATAQAFVSEGASVVVADIDERGASRVADGLGKRAIAVGVDVADEAACGRLIEQAISSLGRIDCLFNNAGMSGTRARTADQTSDDWRRVIDVNLNGVFYCTRAAIPHMRAQGGGVIVNTASVDGLVGMATFAHYTAAKHAVVGFTKAVAMEYAQNNIRSVAICPGYIATAMTESAFSAEERAALTGMVPLRRPAQPEEVANFVLWLASDKASYVTGSAHQVDGGVLAGFAFG